MSLLLLLRGWLAGGTVTPPAPPNLSTDTGVTFPGLSYRVTAAQVVRSVTFAARSYTVGAVSAQRSISAVSPGRSVTVDP